MKKKIFLAKHISSSNYFFETQKSRAYISNEVLYDEFLLEGLSADLWKVILETQNYETIYEYAKSRQAENELDDFLNELKEMRLLTFNQFSEKNKNKHIVCTLEDKERIRNYDLERENWMISNGILPRLIIELTYNCNQHCIHCYNEKDKIKSKLTLENIKKTIDDAVKLGIYEVLLTGGECTLHKDFYEIAKYIKSKRLKLSLITNGQLFADNSNKLNQLIELNPSKVRFSLYSMNSNIHDSITKIKGSHKKIIKVIEELIKNNINVAINYFQLESNKNCIKDVKKYADSINAGFACSMHIISNKNNTNCSNKINEQYLCSMFLDTENPFSSELKLYKEINETFLDTIICKAGLDRLIISPFLDVYPCINVEYNLGNLDKMSILDIWNGKALKDYKEISINRNLKDCFKEEYCNYCTYCPGTNYKNEGFLKKSDVSCSIAKILMNIHKQEKERKTK